MTVERVLDAFIVENSKIFYVGMTYSIAKADSSLWTWSYGVGYLNVASD